MTLKIDEAFLERLGWATLPTWTERGTGAGKPDFDDEAIVIDIRDAEVIDLTDAGEVSGNKVSRLSLHHRPGILSAPSWELTVKRFVDVVASSVFILALLPLMIATAVAVKLSSPGPVLYRQSRVGKDGRVFQFAKFRSMRNGAHEDRHMIDHLNEVSGPVFKIKDDPRITRVGAIIRKYSIDELPQFFHVLAGTMSLVGPRPPMPEEVADYDDWHLQRLLAKPGLTCIWQVSGRSSVDFDTWVKMDIEYIARWTPWLDMKLLAKTIPAVLSGRGAY